MIIFLYAFGGPFHSCKWGTRPGWGSPMWPPYWFACVVLRTKPESCALQACARLLVPTPKPASSSGQRGHCPQREGTCPLLLSNHPVLFKPHFSAFSSSSLQAAVCLKAPFFFFFLPGLCDLTFISSVKTIKLGPLSSR
jgi:hypothetical protein